MRIALLAVAMCSFTAAACHGTSSDEPDTKDTSQADGACGTSGDLSGASWSVAKSRFAFGGTPVETPEGTGITAWIGPDGRATQEPFGYVGASLNGGVPVRPDWSNDPNAQQAHVEAYLTGFGIPACQVGSANILGGSHGRTIALQRVVDGIPIGNSQAWASMNDQDQSQGETLYWPAIPAATVTAAKAFRDALKDPSALAAYKAKLPEGARGDGQVIIHHSTTLLGATGTFTAFATWDTQLNAESPVSYDRNGVAVDPTY